MDNLCLSKIVYEVINNQSNPVIVEFSKECDINRIQEAIDIIKKAFFGVLINKTNIYRLKIFIPKGFSDQI